MIRILDRMVLGSFFRLFVLSIFATPPLFILGDVTENLDRYLDRGLTLFQVAYAYLWMLPLYLQWSFPVAALIAAVFTVHNMTLHREVVAAKAGGISFHRLIRPVLVGGAILMVVALALSEVVPITFRVANAILQNEPPRSWRSDFVYQSDRGLALAVTRLTLEDGRMTGVVAIQRGAHGEPLIHVKAETAGYSADEGWTFYSGVLRQIEGPDTVRSYKFQSLRIAGLTETPPELLESPRHEEEMTYRELGRFAAIVERSGGQPKKLMVSREQRISIPVATLIIILFGTPLATSSKRSGTAYGIGISLGTTMLYLLMFKVAAGFGAGGTISPMWAAWAPNVLFLAMGLVLMRRVRT
ncbi:MAG: YjgP/YjgQ family permease [Gemmatimonadetes bacterium]|nr:YjgP/YjgQ family permease [Gemmatimonadota bacterium]